ncbi:MAG: hypothetical protein JXR13_06635 [Thalassovita sp.]
MIKPISALLISTLVLAGCGQSRLNPLNWFGKSRQVEATQTAAGPINPLIPQRSALARREVGYQGQLVAEINTLAIEQVPGGAIVRASGLAHTEGAWDVRLEPLNEGQPVDNTLTFEFRALPGSGAPGTPRTRTLNVAAYVTEQDLSNVRNIQVVAAGNARISRR